jgi:hypothetical protein
MPGKDLPAVGANFTTNGTNAGVVTVASTTAFRANALGWVSSKNFTLNYSARNATAFAGTVTGGTSGATAVVISDSLAGGGGGAGTLTLSTVVGTFQAAETITAGAASATASGAQTVGTATMQRVKITEITDSTHLKVRGLADTGLTLNVNGVAGVRNLGDFAPKYTLTDISAHTTALAGRIDQDQQFIYDEPR